MHDTTAPGKRLELSQYMPDQNGISLRIWAQGRFWPVRDVYNVPWIRYHVLACTRCDWTYASRMVVLCEPSWRITDREHDKWLALAIGLAGTASNLRGPGHDDDYCEAVGDMTADGFCLEHGQYADETKG